MARALVCLNKSTGCACDRFRSLIFFVPVVTHTSGNNTKSLWTSCGFKTFLYSRFIHSRIYNIRNSLLGINYCNFYRKGIKIIYDNEKKLIEERKKRKIYNFFGVSTCYFRGTGSYSWVIANSTFALINSMKLFFFLFKSSKCYTQY